MLRCAARWNRPGGKSLLGQFKQQGIRPMRKSVLLCTLAAVALPLAACSEKTQDAAATTADSAASDTAANADKAADAVADAAKDVGEAASDAASDAAKGTAKALHKAGDKVDAEASEAAR
jgi:hypothetical protein